MDSIDSRQEVTQKQQEDFQQKIFSFQKELQELVHKYAGVIPADILFMQLSFWAHVNMKEMMQAGQRTPNDATIN